MRRWLGWNSWLLAGGGAAWERAATSNDNVPPRPPLLLHLLSNLPSQLPQPRATTTLYLYSPEPILSISILYSPRQQNQILSPSTRITRPSILEIHRKSSVYVQCARFNSTFAESNWVGFSRPAVPPMWWRKCWIGQALHLLESLLGNIFSCTKKT